MANKEIKEQILANLKQIPHSLSTRGVCNSIFKVEKEKYIVLPGKSKMDSVRYCLKSLEKEGKIIGTSRGMWKFNKNSND